MVISGLDVTAISLCLSVEGFSTNYIKIWVNEFDITYFESLFNGNVLVNLKLQIVRLLDDYALSYYLQL